MYKKVDNKNKLIRVHKGILKNTFFLELNGIVFGYFRKTPLGWILFKKNHVMKFSRLSDLFNYVEEKISA